MGINLDSAIEWDCVIQCWNNGFDLSFGKKVSSELCNNIASIYTEYHAITLVENKNGQIKFSVGPNCNVFKVVERIAQHFKDEYSFSVTIQGGAYEKYLLTKYEYDLVSGDRDS
jgi:hypothetical protein